MEILSDDLVFLHWARFLFMFPSQNGEKYERTNFSIVPLRHFRFYNERNVGGTNPNENVPVCFGGLFDTSSS